MALTYSGESVPTENGFSLRAEDSISGKIVTVKASHEVIQDYGLPQVQAMGEKKYNSGKIEENGTVLVRTSDFNA